VKSLVGAVFMMFAIAACTSSNQTSGAVKADEEPAKVAKIEGTNLKSVTLSARAAERLGIVTQPVREVPAANGVPAARSIPLAAVIYDTHGDAWAYAVSQPLTFVRRAVKVARVQGDIAILESGPEVGTAVVVVGVAELFGAETGLGGT
jgi:hypothetical protein